MQWLWDLLSNPFLMAGMTSWLLAQVIKAILYAIINKKFDIRRLFGDGGMPSGHSATVTSLAVMSGLQFGLQSFPFAMATILAVVVCKDAMGVRQETGKQAVVLKELTRSFEILTSKELVPEVRLKEFVGHTPMQVLAGILLGAANTVAMYYLWW